MPMHPRVPIAVLLIVATVVALFFAFASRDGDLSDYERVRVRSVMFGKLAGPVVLGGKRVEPAHKGQLVTPGQVLACVDTGAGVAVAARSPVSGRVVGVLASPGDRIATGTDLFVIRRLQGD